MLKKTVKKGYSFLNLLTLNVGCMVGIGIFFKNEGIIGATHGNPWLVIAAWIIGGIAVMALAIGFSEVATSTIGERGTLSKWADKFISRKVAKMIAIFFQFIWYPAIILTIALFSAEFTFAIWAPAYFEEEGMAFAKFMTYFGLAGFYMVAIMFANAKSNAFGKMAQLVGTIIKFIPLLVVLVLGFVHPVSTTGGVFGKGDFEFNPILIIGALPGVLFALDSFLNGLNLQGEENKKGDAIRATLIAVVGVAIFYTIIAVSVMKGADGPFITALVGNLGAGFSSALFACIVISALTVLNGLAVSSSRFVKQVQEDKLFTNIKMIDEVSPTGEYTGAIKFMTILSLGWFAVLMIAGYMQDKSYVDFIDNWSNIAVLGGFLSYSIIILGALANRVTGKVKVEKKKYFVAASIIGLIFSVFTTFYVTTGFLFGAGIVKYFIYFGILLIVFLYYFQKMTSKDKE